MNKHGIQCILFHPTILRRKNNMCVSVWQTAEDLSCKISDITYGQEPSSRIFPHIMSRIIGGLCIRNHTTIAFNIAVRDPIKRGRVFMCDFLAGSPDSSTVVGVVLCEEKKHQQKCRKHARHIKRCLEDIVPSKCKIKLYVALGCDVDLLSNKFFIKV